MVYYTLAAVVSSTLYFVVFIPSNVGIRKAQRRIHADARRLGQRSSSRFPPLSPTRVSSEAKLCFCKNNKRMIIIEPGTSAVTPGGPSAEIFTP